MMSTSLTTQDGSNQKHNQIQHPSNQMFSSSGATTTTNNRIAQRSQNFDS